MAESSPSKNIALLIDADNASPDALDAVLRALGDQRRPLGVTRACVREFHRAHVVRRLLLPLAKVLAQLGGVAIDWIGVGLGENARGYLIPHGFEHIQDLAFRQTLGGESTGAEKKKKWVLAPTEILIKESGKVTYFVQKILRRKDK